MSRARAAAAALALLVAGAASAGCRSTQATSAEKARHAGTLLHEQGLRIRRPNAQAVVTGTAVVHDANGTAAVVVIRNRGGAQADVPVGVAVRSRKGATLYRNDTPGLERSLVSVPLLAGRGRTFWINNQIPPTGGRPRAVARLGAARRRAPGRPPRIAISHVALGRDTSGVFATGVVANRSRILQKRLTIAVVATRGGRVVAAGRAVIDRLAPAPTPKPTRFTVYFIGDPRGARLAFAAPPTVLQ